MFETSNPPDLPARSSAAQIAALAVALLTAACGSSGPSPVAAFEASLRVGAFQHSSSCARCHSHSPTARALTTETGDDASPHGLWQASPMANSFRDPYWRAQMASEIERRPAERAAIEGLCLRCHAPMVSHQAALDGRELAAMESLISDPMAIDGVSCTVCHQATPELLGSEASFDGRLVIRDDKRIFGPYADPVPGPMRMNTGYTPTHAPHISSSALCGSCHTLRTEPSPDAAPFLEQAPYLEWRNSVYSTERGDAIADGGEARSCQDCHMADLGSMKIARMPTGDDFNIPVREGVRGHVLVGGNAWLLDLLAQNRAELAVAASESALLRAAAATRAQLAHRTAKLSIEAIERTATQLRFELAIENLAGHKLPSGYPARRAWLEVEIRGGGRTLFHSGAVDERGRLIGVADEFALPHVQVVRDASQVAVYEMVVADGVGKATTSLLSMSARIKDTRLLPKGWRADGPHADETAPVGVDGDADFLGGGDRVRFELSPGALEPVAGPLTVIAWLRYQPMPPAWVAPLRASNTREARDFVRMYDAAKFQPETLALAIRVLD